MFEVKVKLENMLSIKIEKEWKILVGTSIREDKELHQSLSTKSLTGSDILYCSRFIVKSPTRNIFFESSSLSFSKKPRYSIIRKFINL